MFKRDYIERMATQIAKMIAELLGFDTTERLEYIKEVFDTMLDGDSQKLDVLDGDDLINYLSNEKGLQLTEIELMGNLFHQKGKTLMEMDLQALAIPSLRKALTLLDYVDEEMDIFSMDRREVIAELKTLLSVA